MLRLLSGFILALAVTYLAANNAMSGTTACGALTRVKTTYDRATEPKITSQITFAEVPNSRVSFKIGGKGKSCVLVTYSARMQATLPEKLWLRVILDGKTAAEPGALVATANDEGDAFEAQSFTWIFPAVSPGSRNIRVEYRSENGSQVGIGQQTVVVQYR